MKEIEDGPAPLSEEFFCGGEGLWVCVEGGVLGRMAPYHPPNSAMLCFE